MKKATKGLILILLILIPFSLTSCGVIDSIKSKFDNSTSYFDYLESDKIDQISIQSMRDKSFKFLVTDEKSIMNMYDLLSNAKTSEEKSELQPDYVFEIKMGEEVKTFYYVVGAYEGNFYDDTQSFTVSKRLDEGILQNLSIIRKPRDFEYIYYNPIVDVINKLEANLDYPNVKVGVDINGDIECLKYVFSTDIENFLVKARKTAPNIEIVNNNEENFDVIVRIKNRGHSSTVYKSNITVEDKKNGKEYNYYIVGENEYKEWNIKVYDSKNVPKDVEKNW